MKLAAGPCTDGRAPLGETCIVCAAASVAAISAIGRAIIVSSRMSSSLAASGKAAWGRSEAARLRTTVPLKQLGACNSMRLGAITWHVLIRPAYQ